MVKCERLRKWQLWCLFGVRCRPSPHTHTLWLSRLWPFFMFIECLLNVDALKFQFVCGIQLISLGSNKQLQHSQLQNSFSHSENNCNQKNMNHSAPQKVCAFHNIQPRAKKKQHSKVFSFTFYALASWNWYRTKYSCIQSEHTKHSIHFVVVVVAIPVTKIEANKYSFFCKLYYTVREKLW